VLDKDLGALMTPSPMKHKELSKVPDISHMHLSLRKMVSNVEPIASEPSKEIHEKPLNNQEIIPNTNTNTEVPANTISPKKIFSVVKCPDALK
jgi:hypothetical protein